MTISGGMVSTSTYDSNGNQISGNGRATTWTSYNRPASITQGSRTISFLDDPEHQRFQQVTARGTILYFDGFGAHEELVMGSSWKWNDFLTVGNVMVGVRSNIGGTATTSYFHADHLGSISVITDQSGNVLERLSYDAWGKRRFANGADDPSGSITSQTTRGFTNQEELGVSGLVHLNGRIYDPLLGRMTSADPTVPDPLNAQAWNRYSYVGNDPLTFTDPSGFSWLSHFFHQVANFLRANPLVRAVVQIAIATALAAIGNFELSAVILAAAASAAIVTGLSGGRIGDIIKAAAIAGATAVAFYGVGEITQPALGATVAEQEFDFAANIAGHAAVGCLSAVASGGACGPGALSAGAGAAAAPLVGGVFPHPRTDSVIFSVAQRPVASSAVSLL
jgi:RHS repeat-associated protein